MSTRNEFPGSSALATGVSRYDLLLVVLPLPLLLGAFIGLFSTFSLSMSIAMGSFPSTLLMGYGLFYDDPTNPV